MLKIRALNHESSSDEEIAVVGREAQEEIVLELYNKALRLQIKLDYQHSIDVLDGLLTDNIPQLETYGALPNSLSSIRYSCHLNIANAYLQLNDNTKALDNYIQAVKLDETDVTLWHKIGKLSLQIDRFELSIYAFTKGLECSERHWPCLDALITVLYAVQDVISCLYYIGQALTLNPDYTKGLYLRREIYRKNSAAEEYYKLYNPDHRFEPNITDCTIDEDDAKRFQCEVQHIMDRIDELEHALKPKPRATIGLPKKLVTYTWLAFGNVISHLYQYLTDNKLDYITFIDLETSLLSEEKAVDENQLNADENCATNEIQSECANTSSQQIINEIYTVEGLVENTPNQTDIDEETPQETDTLEDVDDNNSDTAKSVTDKTRNLNRSSNKRKRDLLSELQIWGWHSKRKMSKKGKPDRDLTVEDALNRIIPQHLLRNKIDSNGEIPTISQNDTDDTINLVDVASSSSNEGHSENLGTYFGSAAEEAEIREIWHKKRTYCDVVVLIQEFLTNLCRRWNEKWPSALITHYTTIYRWYREYYNVPEPFTKLQSEEELIDDALITVLYGELINFNTKLSEHHTMELSTYSFLPWIASHTLRQMELQHNHNLFLRIFWLRAHLFRMEGYNDPSINALSLIQTTIEKTGLLKTDKIHLSNCQHNNRISKKIVQKLIQQLEMVSSLNCIEDLYKAEKFTEVIEIVQQTFNGRKIDNDSLLNNGCLSRPAQLAIFMEALWHTDLNQCFIWTVECYLEAVEHFLHMSQQQFTKTKWNFLLDKCLLILYEIFKTETVIIVDVLSVEKRACLVEGLCKFVCRQLKSDALTKMPLDTIVGWILLHYVLLRDEHRQQANRKMCHLNSPENSTTTNHQVTSTDQIPQSAAILFTAHQFLGPKGWCLTSNGQLLHFILDTILDRLDSPIFEPVRDKVDIHIEQTLFCLYQHPSKKNKISRHLADHNVDPLPLTWHRSFQLYEFYVPDSLPEFNSFKNASISADTEQLLQRILALVPSDTDPQPYTERIQDVLRGKTKQLPMARDFPYKVKAIYYLLGDYYFKQQDFGRCVRYFLIDLCIHPKRFDSWACLGLSYVSQLENTLNYCKPIRNEMEFLDKAELARTSFRIALDLDSAHIMLWIEYGFFEYMVYSFCSRVLKTETDTLSMDRFENLENEKNRYLDNCGQSFEKAIELYHLSDEPDADERWLQYYILGKVAEKRQKEPQEYLQYYLTAVNLLSENNAEYPEKINYHNPQHLAVEALELRYRINASILKYLELHDGKPIPADIGHCFRKNLDSIMTSSSKVNVQKSKVTLDEEEEVRSCIHDLINKVVEGVAELSSTTQVVDLVVDQNDTDTGDVIVLSDSENDVIVINDNGSSTISSTTSDNSDDDDDGDVSDNEDDGQHVQPQQQHQQQNVNNDNDDTTTTTTSSVTSMDKEFLTQHEILTLVERCLHGLEDCVQRLPQNYKALYRMAHAYFHYKPKRDLIRCRQLLIGQYTCRNGGHISGLFADRKSHNFFHGIWRIPSSEIDRPGSLSAHMTRCITLLLELLRTIHDTKILLDLCVQFRKVPDPDKIYIKDSDRVQFEEQAFTMCQLSFKTQIQQATEPKINDLALQRLLQDLYRACQRIQKHVPAKEAVFSSMLADVFKKFKQGSIPDNVSTLDLATKYCQQQQQTSLVIKHQKKHTPPRHPHHMTNAPVLPAPATITAAPLKRPPTLTRPRGRPPLPKQVRPPRAATLWPNYNYLKQYQEQLLKQYNSNSALTTSAGGGLPQQYLGHSSQMALEHMIKQMLQYAPSPPVVDQLPQTLMKERPQISITPVTTSPSIATITSSTTINSGTSTSTMATIQLTGDSCQMDLSSLSIRPVVSTSSASSSVTANRTGTGQTTSAQIWRPPL